MSIDVIKPGFLTTIQDNGRFGLQQYGMIVIGVMDDVSYRLGNFILKQERCAALEFTIIGPTIQFTQPTVFVLTGADFKPALNGNACPMWRPINAKPGDILKLGVAVEGARGYLHVKGGFLVQKKWGSRSTYLRANLGGYFGRALQAGDVIPYQTNDTNHIAKWYIDPSPFVKFSKHATIRITEGSEFNVLTKQSVQALTQQRYTISPNSDRMGYRIHGEITLASYPHELLSEAVAFGTVQLPPSGEPIILMADRQTTGGYPKIAQVASIDLPTLAQMKPGETIQFEWITLAQAQALYIERERALKQLQYAIQYE